MGICVQQRQLVQVFVVVSPVSSIPELKAMRQKDDDKYYANIALSPGENVGFIFITKDLHLATSTEQHWLNYTIVSRFVFRHTSIIYLLWKIFRKPCS